MRAEMLCIFVLRVASGPRLKICRQFKCFGPHDGLRCPPFLGRWSWCDFTTRHVMQSLTLLLVPMLFFFSFLFFFMQSCFALLSPRLRKRDLVYMLLVHNVCLSCMRYCFVFFSSSWCRGRLQIVNVALPGLIFYRRQFNQSRLILLSFLIAYRRVVPQT